VAVIDLFDTLERELRNDCERERIELIIAPTSLCLLTDQELMLSILRNLLTNAVKYAPGGRVLVGCRRRGDSVRIEVHDEGPGVPEEKLEMMFGEFVRLEREKTAAKEGLGLGLSIASRLAQMLGVDLSVASRVGKGTVFWIVAPMARSAASAARADTPKGEDLSGLRIAVLDDEPDSLAAMVRVLEDAGGAAKGYGYADRYIEAVSAGEKFDLLIVDPLLRGQALAGLNNAEGGPPEIIVTGSTDPKTLARLKESGSAWLVKPVAEHQLLAQAARSARAPR
jgi:anti-sigma regulatory factor (Ser/Thr protein kinase)/CheY-like chemotaxis protein